MPKKLRKKTTDNDKFTMRPRGDVQSQKRDANAHHFGVHSPLRKKVRFKREHTAATKRNPHIPNRVEASKAPPPLRPASLSNGGQFNFLDPRFLGNMQAAPIWAAWHFQQEQGIWVGKKEEGAGPSKHFVELEIHKDSIEIRGYKEPAEFEKALKEALRLIIAAKHGPDYAQKAAKGERLEKVLISLDTQEPEMEKAFSAVLKSAEFAPYLTTVMDTPQAGRRAPGVRRNGLFPEATAADRKETNDEKQHDGGPGFTASPADDGRRQTPAPAGTPGGPPRTPDRVELPGDEGQSSPPSLHKG